LLINSKDKHASHGGFAAEQAKEALYSYGSRYGTNPVPKYRISSKVSLASSAPSIFWLTIVL
jgi:glutamate decarboxylase